ncbi:hypothetical protein [Phenylobacterium sp.]|uniref:hypothetical protein n=1 Tax=Phenylobacterium sp. TaxID=1871053 RepID=UPI002F93D854
MTETEQHAFALELLVTLRLSLDPPEVRARLMAAVSSLALEASPETRQVHELALTILRSGEPLAVVSA